MPEAPWRINRGDPIYAEWLNLVADAVLQRITLNRGKAQRIANGLALQVGDGRRGGIGGGFWAEITDYDEADDGSLTYSWKRLDDETQTGDGAVDLYAGGLALIGEVALMCRGRDSICRFEWRHSWVSKLTQCDSSATAYVQDPTDDSRQILVDRVAGFYVVDDDVLIVPSVVVGESECVWTIADRIPMVLKTPLSGSYSGVSGDTAAALQDDPSDAGCEAS